MKERRYAIVCRPPVQAPHGGCAGAPLNLPLCIRCRLPRPQVAWPFHFITIPFAKDKRHDFGNGPVGKRHHATLGQGPVGHVAILLRLRGNRVLPAKHLDVGIIRFAAGTLIRTQEGKRLIDTLAAGDLIWTRDSGFCALRWCAS
ncbi:MAG: hypothetical protein FJX25_14725 [Alphaproteobacteria bacterium]|nr:hypothetical protein [Alphaproteobacteria bacterium]